MPITIALTDIKRKAMVSESDTSYDSMINALISEMKPAIEYTIADEYLADSTNTNLQAVLKLGILEIISAEFLSQLKREPGTVEEFAVAGLTVGAWDAKAEDLATQGNQRLEPFQKSSAQSIISNTLQLEFDFGPESCEGYL